MKTVEGVIGQMGYPICNIGFKEMNKVTLKAVFFLITDLENKNRYYLEKYGMNNPNKRNIQLKYGNFRSTVGIFRMNYEKKNFN